MSTSNVTPIRQDDTFDWTNAINEMREHDAAVRLFNEVMQEHDKAERDARDRGRIEGALVTSAFVLVGFAAASLIVI